MELIVRNWVCARPFSCHFGNLCQDSIDVIADLRSSELHDSDFVQFNVLPAAVSVFVLTVANLIIADDFDSEPAFLTIKIEDENSEAESSPELKTMQPFPPESGPEDLFDGFLLSAKDRRSFCVYPLVGNVYGNQNTPSPENGQTNGIRWF